MPFEIDVRTVVLAIFVGDLVSALLLWAYGEDRKDVAPYRAFMAAKAIQAAAWLLIGLRFVIPAFLSVGLANFLFFVGFCLAAYAILSLGQEHTAGRLRFFLILGLVTGLGFLLIVSQHANLRIAYVAIVSALCFTLPVSVHLVLGRPRTRLGVILSALYTLSTVGLFVRGLTALLSPGVTLMVWDPFHAFSLLPAYLLMLLGSVGFLLLMKEDSDRDLLRAATHDELTGLLNRAAFLERAGRMLALAARRFAPVSLFMIDLDRFKLVNDTHGHLEGDRVLRDFAAILRGQLRCYDVFGRYGGEEFVVLLPNTGRDEALLAAERLREAVQERDLRSRNGEPLLYTVSVGVCTCTGGRELSVDELLGNGDKALYRAKELGRNRVETCGASCGEAGPASPRRNFPG